MLVLPQVPDTPQDEDVQVTDPIRLDNSNMCTDSETRRVAANGLREYARKNRQMIEPHPVDKGDYATNTYLERDATTADRMADFIENLPDCPPPTFPVFTVKD